MTGFPGQCMAVARNTLRKLVIAKAMHVEIMPLKQILQNLMWLSNLRNKHDLLLPPFGLGTECSGWLDRGVFLFQNVNTPNLSEPLSEMFL